MGSESKRILWVSPSDPWSRWTLSGISREICLELKRRNLLYGALWPGELTLRHFSGPALFHDLEHRILRVLRKPFAHSISWGDEREGLIGQVLRQCPAGTIVIYALLRPKIDSTLNIRRFRWMDLSLLDAVRTGSFGYAGMADAEKRIAIADEQRMLACCEGVVSLSTYAADSISRDLGFPRQKITPIGAGPALDVPKVSDDNVSRYRSGRILFVGRDWERKRGGLVVEAWRTLRKTMPHATLTIVGPTLPPVPIEDGIEFIGSLDKGNPAHLLKLHALFSTSNALCMASTSEPWGLVYVEAAQFGLPVVALNDWALPDIVVDGVTGRLVSAPEAELMAAALEEIFSDPLRAQKMGEAAKDRVMKTLSWSAVVDRILMRVSPEVLHGRHPQTMREISR